MEQSIDHRPGQGMSDTQELTLDDDIDQFDLTCPACGNDLLADATYNDWRVCGRCHRHFWVSARERATMIARAGQLIELPYSEPQVDPVEHHHRLSAADRQDDARQRSALADAVVTGRVSFDGGSVIAALIDAVLLPGGLGIVTTDKVIAAIRTAIRERLPMVIVCGGGSQSGLSGLLQGAQSLRLSGAIAELHRAGLPLIAVLTHPAGGNLLGGVAVNADLRLAEPGFDGGEALVPDEIVDRPELIGRIATILNYLRRRGGPDVVMAGSSDAASARLATFDDQPAVVIALQSNEWKSAQHWSIVRRAQRTASNLNLPIVFAITGSAPLSLDAQVEIRDLLLRHRKPVIGIIQGDLTSAHINLLAVDTVIAASDLAIPGSKAKRYTAQEGRAAGMVDVVAGSELAVPVARAIAESLRLSPARRIARRIHQADCRGAEVPETRELTRLELRDLREVQANVMRSVEEWRHRLEQRDFNLPAFSNFQGLPAFRNMPRPKLQVTKPDLIEMRDKWMNRRRPGQPDRDDEQ
jgi:acetyl-CoA carboxylase carboxyl transferase subunit beta